MVAGVGRSEAEKLVVRWSESGKSRKSSKKFLLSPCKPRTNSQTQNQNLNILLDVKLQLSVELGKTELPIKKVLELTKGSIVTLNKAAGEPVELYANGKLIAFGEVVVIEDNFGLRITHITDPVKRLNTINGASREE